MIEHEYDVPTRLTRLETLMEAHQTNCMERQEGTDKKFEAITNQLASVNAKLWAGLVGVISTLVTVLILLVLKK